MSFQKLFDKYKNTNIVLRIILGIILGTIFAFLCPQISKISILGDLFVGALKGVAPLLVSILIISSLALGTKKNDGRFRTVIFFYLLSTLVAAFIAVGVSYIFPQTLLLSVPPTQADFIPSGIGAVISNMLTSTVVNPILALLNGNYLGILFWSVIIGLVMKTSASDTTKNVLADFAACISKVVAIIIEFAPLGVMGLVFKAVSTSGIDIFTQYGKMVLLLAGCMVFIYFVTNPLIVYLALRINPYPLIIKCLRESCVTAFFTRSSAANIPMNLALCENLGLDKNMYSVSIPLGSAINMNGAAVTISIMTLAAVHTLGINVTVISALFLSILSTFAACGASGIAGGSLLLIPMACSLFGISNDIAMQVVGIGFIIGVIQDSFETALNSGSDVVFTATAEFFQWKKEGRKIPKI